MRKFDYSILEEIKWDKEILSYVGKIHEYKGKQDLYIRQKPAELENLMQIAKIQSTISSNAIEGIVTTNARVKKLMVDKTTPRNRDEEEILGYRNVLNTIHESYEYIPINPSSILQLHRDLLQFTEFSYGGKFKNTPNEIDMIDSNGNKTILFKPLQPYETPDAILNICDSYKSEIAKENIDALILIPYFILDFLCVHPFNDGNGRMSRLLTLLLLYQNGYLVGKYISIEKTINDTKEAYYEALQLSDQNWHKNKNDPMPFVKYMLGVILNCYRQFEDRIEIANQNGIKSSAYDIVKLYVDNNLGKFTKNNVLVSCPSIKSSSVEASLKKLVDEGYIVKQGKGKNTFYYKKQ